MASTNALVKYLGNEPSSFAGAAIVAASAPYITLREARRGKPKPVAPAEA